MTEVTQQGTTVTEKHCAVDWIFQGEERDGPPRLPKGKWSKDPTRLWLQVQAAIGTKACDKQQEKGAAPATVAVTPCAAGTLCFATSAKSAPELLVRSRVLPGGSVAVAYLPLGASATEVWSSRVGEPADGARSWLVAAAPASGIERPGFIDLAGYAQPPKRRVEPEWADEVEGLAMDEASPADAEIWGDDGSDPWVDEGSSDAALDVDALPSWEEELLQRAQQAAAPAPPAGPWLSTPALPGFRFKALLAGAPLVQSTACPKQTLCLGSSPAIPAQLFARVTPRQANGKRWVAAGKLADAAAQLWVQQGTAGEVRYYALAARPAASPRLPAIFDRLAFGG
jgi:hypothetical protein